MSLFSTIRLKNSNLKSNSVSVEMFKEIVDTAKDMQFTVAENKKVDMNLKLKLDVN